MDFKRSWLALTILAMALAMPALSQETVDSAGSKQRYVYYGDHEIYFRPETSTYFWHHDGEWHSGSVLPEALRNFATAGGLTVDLDTERPYERHAIVVERYAIAHPPSQPATERVVANQPDGSTAVPDIKTVKAARKYVYYGEHEIYFAPETKTWFWQRSGRWESGTTLPASSPALGDSIGMPIDLETELPYERHEFVVEEYEKQYGAD